MSGMSQAQASEIMGMFVAAWPDIIISDMTMGIWWESALSGTEFDVAREAALDLIASDDSRFPTPAAFNGRKSAILRRRSNVPQTAVEQSGKWTPDPRAKSWFETYRQTLRNPGAAEQQCATESPT